MATQTLARPTLLVNGIPLGIVPNTMAIVLGKGETMTHSQSTGGTTSEIVTGIDATTYVGQMNFDIYTTAPNLAVIEKMQDQPGENVIMYVNQEGTSGTISAASVTTDPSQEMKADGQTSIAIKGSPVA